MKDIRVPIYIRLLVVIAVCLGVVGCERDSAAKNKQPAVPVVVADAEQRELAPVTFFPGTVISRHDARLAAEVEGRIISVAEVGDIVNEGDAIAQLDSTILRETLRENEAQVVSARAKLKYSAREVERLRPLVKENNVSRSLLDQTISNRDVARSEVDAARARVAQAKERLQRTTVRAPFSGVVTERLLQVGEWVDSGDAVVRLVNTETLEVQARVPVTALKFVESGSKLQIHGHKSQTDGTVRTIVPVGDDRSRLYEVRLTLDQVNWPAGLQVKVAIPTAEPRTVVAVPRDALVLRRDGTSVFRVIDNQTAERMPVNTGIADGSFIEVSGGIEPGDLVVVRGGERLRPGQNVEIQGNGIPQ